MNEQSMETERIVEIDLKRIMDAVIKKGWLILLAAVVASIIGFFVTFFFISPKYQSSALFYVNNSSLSVGDASFSISSGDLSTSRNLVKSYIVILNTRESLNDVIDYAGVDYTYSELKRMISASSVDETEIFEVVVTSEDPYEAEKIANGIAYILPKRIASIIEGTSAKVVDSAVIPSRPSSPSYTNNTLIGFLIGFLLMTCSVALQEFFDITVRSEDDITNSCKYPVLTAVPDMSVSGKGGYDYGYERNKHPKKLTPGARMPIIGQEISFAASEAYKLLRTKLQFSFADENKSHVIGISSALSGEGKSLTAINLAYSLSLLDKKVILIDCDMRRPTLAEKLNIQKKPGFSSYLTGQCSVDGLIQYCGIKDDEQAFHVITAGQNPPNPQELLSSARMQRFIKLMRSGYDYIILDLPPIEEVSDALAVTKETDGILMVVRQNYCNRLSLNNAIRQLTFVGAKILGVVYNCTDESSGKYKSGYYKKYGKRHYSYGRKSGKNVQ